MTSDYEREEYEKMYLLTLLFVADIAIKLEFRELTYCVGVVQEFFFSFFFCVRFF